MFKNKRAKRMLSLFLCLAMMTGAYAVQAFTASAASKATRVIEGFESNTNVALKRGWGMLPTLAVTDKEKHAGEHSLKVTREAQEATVKFDVSAFIGEDIVVKAYVKTADSKIRIGYDDDEPTVYFDKTSTGSWQLIEGSFTVPSGITSAYIYIETDGNADYYVDDVRIEIAFKIEYGDLDNDKEITVTDALAVLRFAAKLSKPNAEEKRRADVDVDGEVTVTDALAVLRVAAKLAAPETLDKEYNSGMTYEDPPNVTPEV